MIDRDGYRPNVGIILCNHKNEVFWGKRVREHSWQFPQGGIKHGETPEAAMYRELMEEVGLRPEHVKILGRTRDWLRYDVPNTWINENGVGHIEDKNRFGFCSGWLAEIVMYRSEPVSTQNSTPGVGVIIGCLSIALLSLNEKFIVWH